MSSREVAHVIFSLLFFMFQLSHNNFTAVRQRSYLQRTRGSCFSVGPSVGRSTKLLLVLASTIILGSESRWTHDRTLLSDDSASRAIHRFSVGSR
jgi:hypothetical protein